MAEPHHPDANGVELAVGDKVRATDLPANEGALADEGEVVELRRDSVVSVKTTDGLAWRSASNLWIKL